MTSNGRDLDDGPDECCVFLAMSSEGTCDSWTEHCVSDDLGWSGNR